MLLAIDAGNTNIVFAVCDGDVIRNKWRLATNTARTSDEYAVWLAELLQLHGLSFAKLSHAVIGTVVPALLFDLRLLCRQYLKCEPLIIGDPDVDLGIGVNTDRPNAVGADRLANAVAAHHLYPGASIVVDFGTATNFDVITAGGNYEGGVIAPGVNLSAEVLHRAAALLPRVAIHRAQAVIGKDTVPAMQSGLYWGYVGLIEGLVTRIKAEHGAPMKVIATGGLAHLFERDISVIEQVDGDLTIKGLMLIHARNLHRPERSARNPE
jgi:type III pantothenate kinase